MIFQGVIAAYPTMDTYLNPAADIVHSPHFESGIAKLMEGKDALMTQDEKDACAGLLREEVMENEEQEGKSFVQRIVEQNMCAQSKYLDCTFIPPGSVMVESLFSIVGHMFDERRLGTTPIHIEEQVFLRVCCLSLIGLPLRF